MSRFGVGVEVRLREGEQILGLAAELARDLREVVADVAQVGLGALGEPLEVEDRDVGGLELVALGGGEAVQLADVLLEAVGARQVLLAGTAQHLGLELVDVLLQRLDHGIEGVGEAVQDPVDQGLLVVDRRLGELAVQVLQGLALVLAHGGHEAAGDVDVHLQRLGRDVSGEVDEQQLVVVRVDLRPLAELDRVLERDGVQPERGAELSRPRTGQG